MTYAPTDPRSTLAKAAPSKAAGGPCRAAQYLDFRDDSLAVDDGGARTWWARSQAMIVAYSTVTAGDSLAVAGQPDEYMVLFPGESQQATITAGGATVEVGAGALAIVPPGDSAIVAGSDGIVLRVFSRISEELAARCVNAAEYETADANVADFAHWPDPPAGFAIRVYPLAEIPEESGRFGRIFRCTSLMLNLLTPLDGPRDPSKMSPHFHDDFEQISFQFTGDFLQHMRTPWVPDSGLWRDDEHVVVPSPAMVVIPPPMIHTTQAVGDHYHWMIDIFGPPRVDFSLKPGWILNADEYPMPEGVG